MNTIHQFKKTPIASIVESANADVTAFDWFDIFYVGTHTSAEGKKATYTDKHLDEFVANFKPASAPLVVGHPENDSPAWGWVSELKAEKGVLYARADKVDVKFAKLVAKGAFRKRSIRLEKTDKGFNLVHVGFLGAKAPALDDLSDIFQMPEGETDLFEFSAADPAAPKPKPEDKPVELTEKELQEKIDKAKADGRAAAESDFSKEREKLEADKKDADSKLASANKKLEAQAFAASIAGHQKTVEKWIADGKIIPAQAQGMAEFMASLDKAESFSFNKEDGGEQKVDQLSFMTSFIEKVTKSPLGEPDNFSREGQDSDAQSILNKAVAYQKAQSDLGVTISIEDAIEKVGGQS